MTRRHHMRSGRRHAPALVAVRSGAAAGLAALLLFAGAPAASSASVEGTAAADRLFASASGSHLRARAGDDRVEGGGGPDHLEGNAGADVLAGAGGADTLHGGRGADRLDGGEGADILSGDLGDDVLVGGPGADRFRLALRHGQDSIADFSSAEGDRIEFPPGPVVTLAATPQGVVFRSEGGDSVRLDGVTPERLGEWRVPAQTRAGLLLLELGFLAVAALAWILLARRWPARPLVTARIMNAALLAASLALLLYALFPGRFDADGLRMYAEAATPSRLNDAHSPLLVLAMAATRALVPGPAILFTAQLLTWFAGLWLLTDALVRSRRLGAALALAVLCLSPLVSFILVEVNKDAAMAAVGMLILGVATRAALSGRPPRLPTHAAMLVLALIFVSLRANAFIALAPLVLAYAVAVVRPAGRSVLRWGGAAVVVVLALMAADRTLKYVVLDVERLHLVRTLAIFDIAGVARYSGQDAGAELLGPAFPLRARACYTPTGHDVFEWGDCSEVGAQMALIASTPEGRKAISAAWFAAVTEHPVSYIRHRLAATDQLFRVTCVACSGSMTAGVTHVRPWNPGEADRVTDAGRALERFAGALYESSLGRGVYWVLGLAICLGALAIRWRTLASEPLAAMAAGAAASGLAHALALAVLTVASPSRYMHWTIMAAAVAIPLTAAALRPRASAPSERS